MSAKKSRKRKASALEDLPADGESLDVTVDRSIWKGWVEVESEPAFFNVMLREMGVEGIRIEEVISLEQDMLSILPQPVHALIFLFRYHASDADEGTEVEEAKKIWFANQVPDFACASIALLNIVNNIPDLHLGCELQDFRQRTKALGSVDKGVAIDEFDFVRRIHNSFARENDLLAADSCTRDKLNRIKKKEAAAKRRETKAAKKAEAVLAAQATQRLPEGISPRSSQDDRRIAHSSRRHAADRTSQKAGDSDGDFTQRSSKNVDRVADGITEPRRSKRQRRSQTDPTYAQSDDAEADGDEEGFHFVAYMPIENQVWKLDGLNKSPHLLGAIQEVRATGETSSASSTWLDVIRPILQTRMMQFEGADIQFNVMAVVRDTAIDDHNALLASIKLQAAVEDKLTALVDDWRLLLNTSHEIKCESELDDTLKKRDWVSVTLSEEATAALARANELTELLDLRSDVLKNQARLRAAIRDSSAAACRSEESAERHRYDHTAFIRAWVSSLAEAGLLENLLDE